MRLTVPESEAHVVTHDMEKVAATDDDLLVGRNAVITRATPKKLIEYVMLKNKKRVTLTFLKT